LPAAVLNYYTRKDYSVKDGFLDQLVWAAR